MSDKQTLTYLAQFLDAGIAPLDACKRLEEICEHDREAIGKIRYHLNLKRTLASSIHHAGYSSHLEHEIIKVAESCGKLSEALRFTADRILKRQQRSRKLRARLLLPNATLLIMLLINVVISITAKVAVSSILFNIVFTIFIVITITYFLLLFARLDATQWLSLGWKLGLHNTSALFRRFFEYFFFNLLTWQTQAGIDYIAGAKVLHTFISAKAYKNSISDYLQSISQGNSVAVSLMQANLIKTAELKNIAITGEQSGRFSQALHHYLNAEGKRLASTTDTIFTWIPRIYYLIAISYGVSILF